MCASAQPERVMEKRSAACFLDLALRQFFSSVLNEPLPAKLAELVCQLRTREETQKRADHIPQPEQSFYSSDNDCE
jgi:hypothetical protein